MTNTTMTKADFDSIRIYQGSQTETAVCGDDRIGTYRAIATRRYGESWGVATEIEAALKRAQRFVVCGNAVPGISG
jgi:hypothetical protein